MANSEQKKAPAARSDKLLTIIGTVACIILIPILIINLTLIVRSYTNPDKVPSVGGVLPLIVLTDSMYPEIKSGDLIICRTVDAESVAVGDVISFFDPAGNGTSVVTHRVTEITGSGDSLTFRTKGDANNTADPSPVPAGNLVGVYRSRIAGAGNVAMFMQTTQGMIVCVVLPVVLLVGYDVLRRKRYEKAHQQDTEALLRELEELRAAKSSGDNAPKE